MAKGGKGKRAASPLKGERPAKKSNAAARPKPNDVGKFAKKLQDTLTCSVCLCLFEWPVSIPCGHTFCYSCLSDQKGEEETVDCPNCRSAHDGELPSLNTSQANVVDALLEAMPAEERKDEANARLALAARFTRPGRVTQLLKWGADPNHESEMTHDGIEVTCTPLHFACYACPAGQAYYDFETRQRRADALKVAQELIKGGAKPDASDLLFTCRNGLGGWDDLALLMLKKGAEPHDGNVDWDSKDSDAAVQAESTLRAAIRDSSEKVCLALIKAGAVANDDESDGVYTTTLAAEKDKNAVVKALLEAGAMVDSENDEMVRDSFWEAWKEQHENQMT